MNIHNNSTIDRFGNDEKESFLIIAFKVDDLCYFMSYRPEMTLI